MKHIIRAMKTAFFDLDGTLFDTLPDIRKAMNYALSAYDGEKATADEVRRYVGRGLHRALSLAAAEKNPKGLDEDEFELMFQLMVSAYEKHPVDETRPYPGIPQLLGNLKSRGIKLGIVSNKSDSIVQEIVSSLMPGVFDFVMGEGRGFPLKPDPSGLLYGIRETGGCIEEAVYVGDSEVDAETGKRAGVRTLIVSYGFRTRAELEKSGVSVSANSVEELDELMKTLC